MAKKTYYLTVGYDTETEELELFSEELEIERRTFYCGTVDLTEYWDEEGLAYIDEMYDIANA